jgi:hypothetical protein
MFIIKIKVFLLRIAVGLVMGVVPAIYAYVFFYHAGQADKTGILFVDQRSGSHYIYKGNGPIAFAWEVRNARYKAAFSAALAMIGMSNAMLPAFEFTQWQYHLRSSNVHPRYSRLG